MRKFTASDIARVRRLRKQGRKWAEIGRMFGMKEDNIRYHVDPEFRERRKAAQLKFSRDYIAGHHTELDRRGVHIVNHRPSDRLIAEASVRANTPRSLSAWVFGDPPPGYSALDRRS